MQKDLRIVIIGAGMAGILAAIKLLENNYKNFTLYEKADQVGGTWRDNSYPGLTCDVPSHHYTYSFERNPAWSRYYSPVSYTHLRAHETREDRGWRGVG